MITTSVYDARAQLSHLLRQVEEGEEVLITRHGVPVALLTAPRRPAGGEQVRSAIERLRTFSRDHGTVLTDTTIEELRRHGRRP
ncbi:MAG TPA: type II toxin-antitoxin system prevent-host-death family antitoxin [Armatimonadota bacterium]|jgi:prevent-host-death family protein